ncbi:MAG: Ig-like domain-containing protein, partial [Candidatus Staskawiczbacteria bacterium]
GITGTEQITVTAAPSVIPISAASITITSPISTTKWTVGRSNYIRWKETKVTYVNITLTNTATSVTTKIYSKVSASRGYYLWTLPRSLASGNYTITVSDSSNSATNSTSSSFQIVVKVSSVKVTAAGSATTIPVNATLHMSAAVLPANATNPAATWSVTSGTGTATIDPSTGLLTPLTPGTVTVKATAQDGGVIGTKHITIVGACTPNWLCGGWSKTYNGKQTRGCWDQNSCGTTLNEPPTSRNYCTDTVFSADCPAGWHCDGATNTCYGCGDGVCNLNYGETYSNCPTDCSNPVISNPGSCNANCSSQGGGYCQGTCPVGYKCAPTNPSVFTYNILYAGSCVAVQTPTPIPACVGEGQDVTTSYLGGNCCAGLVVSQGKCVNPLTSAQTGYWTYFIDSGDLWTKYGDFGNGPHTCIQLCKSKTLQCLENQCIVPGGIPMMAGGMYQDCSQSGSVSVYCCCSGS